jgi:hypothetical protein
MIWWREQRGFNSSCRICGCWSVQKRHWMPTQAKPDYSNIELITRDQWLDGKYEECIPSDNLEYLEWLYDKTQKEIVK